MFQRFYSRMLSRRLVQTLSLSMEAEETMIYKLKVCVSTRVACVVSVACNTCCMCRQCCIMCHQCCMQHMLQHACGYEYTARLQRMVVDIRLSADTMTEFQDFLSSREEVLPISFSTMVLQSAAWPLHKNTCPLYISPQLQLTKTKVQSDSLPNKGQLSAHCGPMLIIIEYVMNSCHSS